MRLNMSRQTLVPFVVACAMFMQNLDSTVIATALPTIAHSLGETPLRLVEGRERIYFEHFWNEFAADPRRSVSEADRRFYAAEYAKPDGMRAGFEYFRALDEDARDFAEFAKTSLPMPMLVLAGEKASGEFLITQARLVASNVQGIIIRGSGHWLMSEAPEQTLSALVEFINAQDGPAADAQLPDAAGGPNLSNAS